MDVEAEVTLADVAQLRETMLRIARRLRKQANAGLTASQMSALSTLARHETLRIGELARREQIGKSTVTRLVARLESLGHVFRIPDAVDGRGFCVSLTDDGRRLLAQADELANQYLAHQVAALPPEDRHLLIAAMPALEKLARAKP